MITSSGIRGWRDGLASGRLGMQINGYWTPGELKALEVPYTFGYTWMPTVKGDRATIALPWGMGIPANARNPELSFALMEFFASPEAAQIIFDAVGWLNGNLNAVRQLDISDLPEIAPIVAMFEQADRFASAAPVPIMDTVRQRMPEVLVDVWENTVPGPEALANLQTELQATLNEVLKK